MMLLHWAQVPDTLPKHLIAAWLGELPMQRGARCAREREIDRRLETLTGFALLARAAQYLPLPPLSLLDASPGAKLRWPDGPDFSITHASGRAVCAVAPPGVAIGIDLESADSVQPESLRLVTTARERQQVDAGGLTATALWTCKEAVLKAAGTGIRAVREVEIDGAMGHHAGRAYHLTRLDLDRNLLLTIATTTPVSGYRIVQAAASTLFDPAQISGYRSSA